MLQGCSKLGSPLTAWGADDRSPEDPSAVTPGCYFITRLFVTCKCKDEDPNAAGEKWLSN